MASPPALNALRLIHVADQNGYSRCWARLRAFQDMGVNVRTVALTKVGDPDSGGGGASLSDRILGKLGLHFDWVGAGRGVLAALAAAPADIVWIEKGVTIAPAVLRLIRSRHPNTRLVMFSEDDMFLAHNQTRRFVRGLALYDVVFTTKATNIEPGELLPKLRHPESEHRVANRGKRWSPMEIDALERRYRDLAHEGKRKSEIVQTLTREFKRGSWAIVKKLTRVEKA